MIFRGRILECKTFFYPDFTVDSGISPDLHISALVGYHHRSGIGSCAPSPCPEGISSNSIQNALYRQGHRPREGIIAGIVTEISHEYVIETASWRDLKALDKLERSCFGEDAWPLLELLGVLAFPGVVRLKAMIGDTMAGFIAGDGRRSENIGWILTLGVLPEWRRKGIAQALLEVCEQKMIVPKVKLTVRRGNESAINLYQKLGYSQVDIWPRYYHNGEDGLVLEKNLPEID